MLFDVSASIESNPSTVIINVSQVQTQIASNAINTAAHTIPILSTIVSTKYF